MPFGIGWPEIVIVLVIALLLFGPKRLPELGQSVGKTITGFKKGLKESEQELRSALSDDAQPAAAQKVDEPATPVAAAIEPAKSDEPR